MGTLACGWRRWRGGDRPRRWMRLLYQWADVERGHRGFEANRAVGNRRSVPGALAIVSSVIADPRSTNAQVYVARYSDPVPEASDGNIYRCHGPARASVEVDEETEQKFTLLGIQGATMAKLPFNSAGGRKSTSEVTRWSPDLTEASVAENRLPMKGSIRPRHTPDSRSSRRQAAPRRIGVRNDPGRTLSRGSYRADSSGDAVYAWACLHTFPWTVMMPGRKGSGTVSMIDCSG